ncbi:MAG: lipopolysaccharide biosynthesis protein [Pirellulales bacterium]
MHQAEGPSQRTLKGSVRAGLRTVAVVQLASQVVSLGTLTILYRLLSPEDYGLLGMVMPLLMFLRIFATLGLPISTVQRSRLSHAEISSLFWLGLLLSVGTTLVTALLAPAVALFYADSRLSGLTLALAGTAIVVALGTQHQALLERDLQVGRLAWIRLWGQLSGAATAIAAAVAGWGVWALVVQQYVELGVLAACAWWAKRWWPGLPRRGTPVWRHLHLGGYFAASSILFFIATNLDKVLIGRMFDVRTLGLYSQAFNLMMKPVYVVTTPLNGIVLASLSRAAANRKTQTDLMRAYYRLLAILLFPVGVGLALVGPLVMTVLGGPAWSTAGVLLAILSLAIPAQGFLHLNVPLLAAAGRTDRLFAASAAMTAVLATAYGIGVVAGGQAGLGGLGVASAYTVAVVGVIVVPYSVFSFRCAKLDPWAVVPGIRRAAVAAVTMGLVVAALRVAGPLLPISGPSAQLVMLVSVGCLVYLVTARHEIAWLLSQGWAKPGRLRRESDNRSE